MSFNVRTSKLAKYFDFDEQGFESADFGDIVTITDFGDYVDVKWDSYNYQNPFIADCEYPDIETALLDVIKYYVHLYKTMSIKFKFTGYMMTDNIIRFCVKFD